MNKSPTDGAQIVDALTIFAFMREMNDGLLSQMRATNNNIASILRVNLDLQTTITQFIQSFADTRDKRYQEEIDALEEQMKMLNKMLEEKKTAKEDNRSTSEKIQAALEEQNKKEHEMYEQERKRKSIDWIDMRNSAIRVAISVATGALVVWLATKAPAVGKLIQEILAP